MFLEENNTPVKRGRIEVISGSMFSGKTEELIRRIHLAEQNGQRVVVFKPMVDKRYHEMKVVSHRGLEIEAVPVNSATDMLGVFRDADVVGIDEAQFFNEDLPGVCSQFANIGLRIIVAGLDLDYKGRPFGCMPQLMALAESLVKLQAVCAHCGDAAYISHRKSTNQNLVMLGESSGYEPLCRVCFNRKNTR